MHTTLLTVTEIALFFSQGNVRTASGEVEIYEQLLNLWLKETNGFFLNCLYAYCQFDTRK